MKQSTLKDILPLVEKPSRYLGNEIGAVQKSPETVRLRFALAFPDVYEIGMSHFGLQILYHIINSHPEMLAERVYAPGLDMAERLKEAGLPLFSLETHTPISAFDVVGFSLLYELNYTNVLLMLDLSGIPFHASERNASHPFIIAGGPCTVNPEPMAEFFDAMVVGDGENVVLEMADAWLQWKKSGSEAREALLTRWAAISGVYVPAFFQPWYDGQRYRGIKALRPGYQTVRRVVAPDLNAAPFPDVPILPYGRPVHDRLRLEIARGCGRGCRFCQAGMIYRPVRERSMDLLMELADKSLLVTGHEEISLLSLSTGDYSCLSPLMHGLIRNHVGDHVALSLPSFRAGTLPPELMDLIRQVRKTGFTIAPEAGSERLRAVINKNISEKDILDTVSSAFALGWNLIKLYFMIGLPTETEADRNAIPELVRCIRKHVKTAKGRGAGLTVSIGIFVPKPHTPFQWAAQVGIAEAWEMIDTLKRQLRIPGVEVKWQRPEVSLLEGVMARGDRRLARLIETAYRNGCSFDGWSDHFKFPQWSASMDALGIHPDKEMNLIRPIQEPLPWDHIDALVSKDFLADEYHKALKGLITPDCRFDGCQNCGVCDFDAVSPHYAVCSEPAKPIDTAVNPILSEEEETRYQVFYAKEGVAKYFGHLELVNIFIRAIRRSGLNLVFSSGFHPKPKISFHDPLPVGVESLCESFFMSLHGDVDAKTLPAGINRHLPDGLHLFDCRKTLPHAGPKPADAARFSATLPEGVFPEARIQAFWGAHHWPYRKTAKNGKEHELNLKDTVDALYLSAPNRLCIGLKNLQAANIRPGDVIQSVFQLSDRDIRLVRIVKEQFKAPPLSSLTDFHKNHVKGLS